MTARGDADLDDLEARLWADIQGGDHFPSWLAGRLDLRQALALQVRLLRRQLEAGEQLSGWKVGLTSERARKMLGADERPFGYLLASHTATSPLEVAAADLRHGSIEPEFLFTVGERLAGPDVGPEQVRASVARVAAGYELNERRPGTARPDLVLMATDRMTQWGVVEGSGLAPTDLDRSLDDVRVRLQDGDDLRLDVRGGDEVDDHWSSIARLVAVLAEHGLALEAGHKVITGAMGRFDLAPGQRWRAVYDGVGDVEVRVT